MVIEFVFYLVVVSSEETIGRSAWSIKLFVVLKIKRFRFNKTADINDVYAEICDGNTPATETVFVISLSACRRKLRNPTVCRTCDVRLFYSENVVVSRTLHTGILVVFIDKFNKSIGTFFDRHSRQTVQSGFQHAVV